MGRQPKIDPAFVDRVWKSRDPRDTSFGVPAYEQDAWRGFWTSPALYFKTHGTYAKDVRVMRIAYADKYGRLFWKVGEMNLPGISDYSYLYVRKANIKTVSKAIASTSDLLAEQALYEEDAEILLDLLYAEILRRKPKST